VKFSGLRMTDDKRQMSERDRAPSGGILRDTVLYPLCLVLCVLMLLGCEEEKKKAALTQTEIEQLTYAPKLERPDAIHVSGETITCDDLLSASPDQDVPGQTFKDRLIAVTKETTLDQFMELARPQMRQRLNNNITNIVLYKQAQRELGEKADEKLDSLTDQELRQFVFEHGGNNAQADEALKAMGMNRTTFKAYKRRLILAQYSASLKLSKEKPITYSELLSAYNQMKDKSFSVPASVQFSLIDIQPARMDVNDPNVTPLDAARALAAQLLERIKAGEDFAGLAKEYSHGFRSEAGGLWAPRDPASSAPPYDVVAARAMQLQPGEVAGPIETPRDIFIVKLEQKKPKGYRPLGEVQEQIERKIREDRRDADFDRLDAEIKSQAAMIDTDGFLDRCLEHIYEQARAEDTSTVGVR
jgi:peptidyl-prolyl cis-trans isomerase SurA